MAHLDGGEVDPVEENQDVGGLPQIAEYIDVQRGLVGDQVIEEVGEEQDPVELPEIAQHEEVLLEGEALTQNVANQPENNKKMGKKTKKATTSIRPAGKRRIVLPRKYMDMDEDEIAPKKIRPVTAHVQSQMERYRQEDETVPILIQQRKNKEDFLEGLQKVFSF